MNDEVSLLGDGAEFEFRCGIFQAAEVPDDGVTFFFKDFHGTLDPASAAAVEVEGRFLILDQLGDLCSCLIMGDVDRSGKGRAS